MNAQRMLRVLLVLAAALALLFTVDRVQSIDPRVHNRVSDDLRGLKEMDARLDQDVLKSRYRILLNYGPIVRDLLTIVQIENRLQDLPGYLSLKGRRELSAGVSRHALLVSRKAALIEQFKSLNAIQNNSLRYTPVIFGDLLVDLRQGGGASAATLRVDGLLRDVLLYQIASDTLLAPTIRAEVSELRVLVPRLAPGPRSKLETALAHVDVLVMSKPALDRILNALLSVPTIESGEAMLASYTRWHTAAATTSNRTRMLVYLIAVLLLAAVAYTIVQLRRSAKEVADTNEHLEERVRERTGELNTSMERYRALVESTNVVPWEYDVERGHFIYVAPQVARVLGLHGVDLNDQSGLWQVVHPDDVQALKTFLSTVGTTPDAATQLDYRILSPDKGTVDVRSIASLERHKTGRVVRGLSMDVSAQLRLEDDLRSAQKLESVGRLASGIAHEINTPIQFIGDSIHFVQRAFADLMPLWTSYQTLRVAAASGPVRPELLSEVSEAEDTADVAYLMEKVPGAIDRALEGLSRVSTLVLSMKDFAHPDQKEKTDADLNHAISTTLTIARNEYKYVADVETDLGDVPKVRCHISEINQALLNIIVNAAHAIGDVVVGTDQRGRITIATRREGDRVQIRISDTGTGIPEEIRAKIFDPFFTTKQVGKGTGQGLAIARSMVVDKHGGTLTCESEIGKGTTFVLTLPVDDGAGEMARAA